MNDDRKLWVIDDTEEPEITSLGESFTETTATVAPRPAPVRRAAPPTAPRRTTPRSPAAAEPRLHSAILLGLAYVLGPAALLLTRRGRRSGLLVGVAMVSLVTALAAAGGWWSLARGEMPTVMLPILVLLGGLSVFAATTVWGLALHLLLTSRRFPTRPWPAWLKNPWIALAAGIVAPGSGLALARRTRAAALVAWWTWPGAAAALVLAQAPVLWHHRAAFGEWGLTPDTLERAFVAAVLLIVVVAAFWLSQALIGARVHAARAGRWQHARGDWTGLGLAAAVGVFLLAVKPGVVATDLATYAAAMADQEYRVIPLGLTQVAQRLDPGQLAYALQTAELHDARGDAAAADDARAELERRVRPYLGLLAASREIERDVAPVRPRAPELPTPLVRAIAAPAPVPPTDLPATAPAEAATTAPVRAAQSLLFGPGILYAEAEPAPADSLP